MRLVKYIITLVGGPSSASDLPLERREGGGEGFGAVRVGERFQGICEAH
jgi:hypothetical protein